ncbi:twin-arginine translocase subunit TatC [Runella rosea]|jgi:sec-independent protein translocase protein TatC|uniref:Sec-independent protein translocase protein TatC n=2 Tax=Runella TaxID=105 RepID=A0A344TME1_9BACT|nr:MULTISPECIES: twin-arginine translocase subunit TatC [Runella]AXE19812.1 twin-arginine translocase subunit TatC [Runella rosea]RDB02881.1 twin-arginine translocase subunit TatC [Runella aurantiaca]
MPLDQEFDKENATGDEMSFIEHLEELRWHVIRAVGAILIFTIAAFIYIEEIYDKIILGPSKSDFWTYRMLCKIADFTGAEGLCIDKLDFELQSREMAGQFTMALLSSVIIGLLFAFPYAFWEVWRFIKPGLKPAERRVSRGAVFYVTFLFLSGVFFGYYIVSPLAINFLANFQLDPRIKNQFDITSYVGLISVLTLACGLTFQLPVVAFVLSRIGFLNPRFMREYRKHAFVVILILAAVITPSPDVLSQVLVALPLTLLYEISIMVSAWVERSKKEDAELEAKEEEASAMGEPWNPDADM